MLGGVVERLWRRRLARLALSAPLWVRIPNMRALFAFAVLFAAAPVSAEESAADDGVKKGISKVLGKLDWGAAHPDVLVKIKRDIDETYRERLKQAAGDTVAIGRILREKNEAFGEIKKTFTRFTGQRTGYESSLISRDYDAAGDEAVLVVEESEAQRYYFFKHDRLWKILFAFNASVSRAMPFAKFVDREKQKFGEPANVEWFTPKGGEPKMRTVRWEDEHTVLLAEDRTDFFGTFVMKFLEKGEGASRDVENARKNAASNVDVDPQMDAMLDDITGAVGSDDSNVVDQLTGRQAEVDLASGRPEYETLVRASDLREQKKKKKAKKSAKKSAKKVEQPPAKRKSKTKPAGDPGIIF